MVYARFALSNIEPTPFGDKYVLVEHIATGGMAEIYRANYTGIEGFAKELVVKRLREEFAERPDVVQMFLDDTPSRLEGLLSALEAGDATGLERTAHALKSSCGNLGAKRLAKLCFEIESAGRAGDIEAARPLVGRSNEEFAAVSTALRAELG